MNKEIYLLKFGEHYLKDVQGESYLDLVKNIEYAHIFSDYEKAVKYQKKYGGTICFYKSMED